MFCGFGVVFQHIESIDLITDCVRRVARTLGSGGGVGYLHFDTRPTGFAYRARRLVPDPLLPRAWRRGIRRTRRPADQLQMLIRAHGLTVIEHLRPGTEEHVFLV